MYLTYMLFWELTLLPPTDDGLSLQGQIFFTLLLWY